MTMMMMMIIIIILGDGGVVNDYSYAYNVGQQHIKAKETKKLQHK
jgi:hypothetical protein